MTCDGCAQRTRADLGRPSFEPWQTVPYDPQARGEQISGHTIRAVRLAAAAVLVRGLTAEQLQARPRWSEISVPGALVRTAVRWGLIP